MILSVFCINVFALQNKNNESVINPAYIEEIDIDSNYRPITSYTIEKGTEILKRMLFGCTLFLSGSICFILWLGVNNANMYSSPFYAIELEYIDTWFILLLSFAAIVAGLVISIKEYRHND